LRIFLESVKLNEGLRAELSHRFIELWMEDVDKEVIQERRESAYNDIRTRWHDTLQSLEERKRWRQQYAHVEDARFGE